MSNGHKLEETQRRQCPFLKREKIDSKGRKRIQVSISCPKCGKPKWVQPHQVKIRETMLCKSCSAKLREVLPPYYKGSTHPRWKGGRYKGQHGYIFVRLEPDTFFYPMTNKSGYLLEHRLVVAKHLKRHLLAWEIVHHKNGVKDDNRLENLEIMSAPYKHNAVTRIAKHTKQLQERVIQLEAEVALLRKQIQLGVNNYG